MVAPYSVPRLLLLLPFPFLFLLALSLPPTSPPSSRGPQTLPPTPLSPPLIREGVGVAELGGWVRSSEVRKSLIYFAIVRVE